MPDELEPTARRPSLREIEVAIERGDRVLTREEAVALLKVCRRFEELAARRGEELRLLEERIARGPDV
jgi:hypothetical protein